MKKDEREKADMKMLITVVKLYPFLNNVGRRMKKYKQCLHVRKTKFLYFPRGD
jgi:hypothetical protein